MLEVFKRHLRYVHYIHVKGRKENGNWILWTKHDIKIIEEPCNPFLAFFNIYPHMKPCETIVTYENEEIEEIWRAINETKSNK